MVTQKEGTGQTENIASEEADEIITENQIEQTGSTRSRPDEEVENIKPMSAPRLRTNSDIGENIGSSGKCMDPRFYGLEDLHVR